MLYYSWEGKWTGRPDEPYEGFGEILFEDSTHDFKAGNGAFSDRNLTDKKSITLKWSSYRRCTKQHVNVMLGSDSKRIGALVREELENRA